MDILKNLSPKRFGFRQADKHGEQFSSDEQTRYTARLHHILPGDTTHRTLRSFGDANTVSITMNIQSSSGDMQS
jgi:hypothetical protein